MPRFFDFAIVQIAPENIRGERINIGLAIFKDDGLDLRLALRSHKLRALSTGLTVSAVQGAASLLTSIDAGNRSSGLTQLMSRQDALARVGVLSLTSRGQFEARDDDSYEDRISSLLRNYVEPEIDPKPPREKRSSLLGKMKKALRAERILARKDEGLESHRIVPKFPIAEGLVADLALKNGVMHVVETVDAATDVEGLRKVINELGVSGLVLERAKLTFGPETKPRLVYSTSTEMERHVAPAFEVFQKQGVQLINWDSQDDQNRLLAELAVLAAPIEPKLGRKAIH